MVKYRWVAAALVVCCASMAAAGESPCNEDVLDRWLERHAGIESWSADVTQIRSLTTLTRPLTSDGQLWFAQPTAFGGSSVTRRRPSPCARATS
jgi:outer membrane lipoprotein-sorting protein